MSRKYFGTDGVRGCVGEAPITPDFCLRLGYAAGKTLVAREHLRPGDRPAVIIGKDTRISGYAGVGPRSGFRGGGCGCLPGWPLADAGDRLPDPCAASAGWSGDFCIPQPV